MPKLGRCSFCGREFPPGTGTMYIRSDGSTFWFCSSKCRKNALDLKRDARKLKWTEHYTKRKNQSMTVKQRKPF